MASLASVRSMSSDGDQSLISAPRYPEFASHDEPVTLIIEKGVALSLRTDSLIVDDKAFLKSQRKRICGIPLQPEFSKVKIPYHHVLWVEFADQKFVLDFVNVTGKKTEPRRLEYVLDDNVLPSPDAVGGFVQRLMTRAYGTADRAKRAKVLVNPHSGPGGAAQIWERDVKPIFEAARMGLDVTMTSRSGEAVEIAEQINIDDYDTIIALSGDGLPYEIFNGLGNRPDARRALRQIAVVQIPCGSGNAMSINLNGTCHPGPAALAVVKGKRTPMDLVSITQGETRTLSFLSQALGIVADSDLGTEHMRWMGSARFTVGIVQRVFSKRVYPCELAVKVEIEDRNEIKRHYKREWNETNHEIRKESSWLSKLQDDDDSVFESDLDDKSVNLPLLKYGTVNDDLPAEWEKRDLENMGNFYCGNMGYVAPDVNFFPAACPNDGFVDLIYNDSTIPVLKHVEIFTTVDSGRILDLQQATYQKVSAFRLTPRQHDGFISIDGERIPFEPFQAEVHAGLGTVLSVNGRYEVPGPVGWQSIQSSSSLAGGPGGRKGARFDD